MGHRLVVAALLVAAGGAFAAPAAGTANPKATLVAVDDAGHTRWKRAPGDRDLSVVGEADGLLRRRTAADEELRRPSHNAKLRRNVGYGPTQRRNLREEHPVV